MADPIPTLDALTPINQGLIVEFSLNPYVGVNNAYLTIVNDDTKVVSKISLDPEKALEQTYTINGLTNGELYSVQVTQVKDSPTGKSGSSNTLSATPCTVPAVVALTSVAYTSVSTFPDNICTATYTLPSNSSGSDYISLVFTIYNDNSNQFLDNQVISYTPMVQPVAGVQTSNLVLPAGDTYIVSAFLTNAAGYGPLSNSVSFLNSADAVPPPTIVDVVSGEDSKLKVKFTATQPASGSSLQTATVQYQQVGAIGWINGPTYTFTNYVSGSEVEVSINTLVNMNNYNVHVFVSTGTGTSLYSSTMTGVPAKQPTFSNVALEVESDYAGPTPTPTGLYASWLPNPSSFNAPVMVSNFTYVDSSGEAKTKTERANFSNADVVLTTSLKLQSTASVVMSVDSHIPLANQPYWRNPPTQFIIKSATQSASVVVSEAPGPVTNITNIAGEVGDAGAIQFFWDQPVDTGGIPILYYDLYLYNSYPSGQAYVQRAMTTGPVENYTFQGLPTASTYWVQIVAWNAFAPSQPTQFPTGSVGISIPTTSMSPVTYLSAVRSTTSSTAINITWTADSEQPQDASADFVYTKFNINLISPNGSISTINDVSVNTDPTVSTYKYSWVPPEGVEENYTIGVTAFGTKPGGTTVFKSTMTIANYTFSALPTLSAVSFPPDSNGEYKQIQFTCSSGGSLLTYGLVLVPPANEQNNPVQMFDQTVISAINAGQGKPVVVTMQLGYVAAGDPPTNYLITASNAAGGVFLDNL